MGFLSDMFGNNKSQNVSIAPVIPAKMPAGAIQQIESGILPVMNTSKLLLKRGEVCHYVERAILITEKIVRHMEGASKGFSFRVCKGVTYRTGKFKGTPVEERIEEQTKGILYITNKRIVFIAEKNGFDKNFRYLTAVTPYSNGIVLQYGNKNYTLYLPDGAVANRVIELGNV